MAKRTTSSRKPSGNKFKRTLASVRPGEPPLDELEFATKLVRQLNLLGSFTTLEFRIPGTETQLDIYIASPVRAFVEIKSHEPRSPSEVSKLLKQAEFIRRQFGDEIKPIVIILREQWLSQTFGKELHDGLRPVWMTHS